MAKQFDPSSLKSDLNVSDVTQSNINSGGALALPRRLQKTVTTKTGTAAPADYSLVAARRPYTDYVRVRIKGRGGSNHSVYDESTYAVYKFLINPRDINVSRQTLDEQAQSRAGWQIGLKGEDFMDIQISGKTPGRYFTSGLDANYTGKSNHFPGSASYRNLVALELFYENNGYWYEGEQARVKQATKQIKAHSDVELSVGEFIWTGMFTSMSISDSAQSPALSDFKLGFVAWKEAFNQTSACGQNGKSRPAAPVKGHTPHIVIPSTTTKVSYSIITSNQQPTSSVPASSTVPAGNTINLLTPAGAAMVIQPPLPPASAFNGPN